MAQPDKVTPLKLPVRLDLEAYNDAVIHDANWRRIASYPKTEIGIAIAHQVTNALNQSAAFDVLYNVLRDIYGRNWERNLFMQHKAGCAAITLYDEKCNCPLWHYLKEVDEAARAALTQVEELRKGEAEAVSRAIAEAVTEDYEPQWRE